MPYYTGTANSAVDLRNAIVAAATAHGWTWDAANEMLHKHPIYGKLTTSGNNVWVRAALGYSGATLTDPAPQIAGISAGLTYASSLPVSYPLTYHVFIHNNPDDVVVAVNYQVVWWQWLALGKADLISTVPGSGVWHWGTATSSTLGLLARADGQYSINNSSGSGGFPFWPAYADSRLIANTSSIHLGLDGQIWWIEPAEAIGPPIQLVMSSFYGGPLMTRTPNSWNQEATLARIQLSAFRTTTIRAYVGEFAHLRMTRNDNLSDGQIVTIGPERWFVAPGYRKDATARDGAPGNTPVNHTGTLALAVRYDGP